MRNIIAYPVTKDELLVYLDGLMKDFETTSAENLQCGSMQGVYIDALKNLVQNHFDG